jgi:hypothetical protein
MRDYALATEADISTINVRVVASKPKFDSLTLTVGL